MAEWSKAVDLSLPKQLYWSDPLIQGSADADVGGKLTHDEVVMIVDFCLNPFKETSPEERKKVLQKVAPINGTASIGPDAKQDLEKLTEDELKILNHIRAKQMLGMENIFNLNHFGSDGIVGLAPTLKRGNLGVVAKAAKDTLSKLEFLVVALQVPVEEAEPTPAAA
ncbi:MAG: hypothetical protein LQ347_005930 [Umbilicaria vellea]|nr:MAG: hypothetical protein LQ347_005930 [Umbilicaria vellea]